MFEAGQLHANVGAATLNANRQVGALSGVAAMGILLQLVPDWALSIKLAFAAFATCFVLCLVLARSGMTADSDNPTPTP